MSRWAGGDRGRESRHTSRRSGSIRCTNRRLPSRGRRPRRRAYRGHRPSRFSLVAWVSRRNPTAAFVPPELAELLEALELFRREDRTIEAPALVVQRARVADADPALPVPFAARLNRDPAFLREVHDGLHHPLGPAREDLVKLLPINELLGQGRCESGEAAGPVVRRDVDLPGGVRPLDEQEFRGGPRADRGHDPGALLRERLDLGDHRGHPTAPADREDLLAL